MKIVDLIGKWKISFLRPAMRYWRNFDRFWMIPEDFNRYKLIQYDSELFETIQKTVLSRRNPFFPLSFMMNSNSFILIPRNSNRFKTIQKGSKRFQLLKIWPNNFSSFQNIAFYHMITAIFQTNFVQTCDV